LLISCSVVKFHKRWSLKFLFLLFPPSSLCFVTLRARLCWISGSLALLRHLSGPMFSGLCSNSKYIYNLKFRQRSPFFSFNYLSSALCERDWSALSI
jgi:hypothetical protein